MSNSQDAAEHPRPVVAAHPSEAGDNGRGRRLAFDVGSVRIGVAKSDRSGILASPLVTLEATPDEGPEAPDRLAARELVEENFAVEVIVGLPVALRGNHTASTAAAVAFAEDLQALIPSIPVILVDERLSTKAAIGMMHASGVSTKKGRKAVDQAAAVHFLQGWLDARKRAFPEQSS